MLINNAYSFIMLIFYKCFSFSSINALERNQKYRAKGERQRAVDRKWLSNEDNGKVEHIFEKMFRLWDFWELKVVM